MKILTPIKAMRAKCLDCCGGIAKEVRECSIIKCPIWPYRMGKRPVADDLVDESISSQKS